MWKILYGLTLYIIIIIIINNTIILINKTEILLIENNLIELRLCLSFLLFSFESYRFSFINIVIIILKLIFI